MGVDVLALYFRSHHNNWFVETVYSYSTHLSERVVLWAWILPLFRHSADSIWEFSTCCQASYSKIKCFCTTNYVIQETVHRKQCVFHGQTVLVLYWTYLIYHSGYEFLDLLSSSPLLYSGPYLPSYFIH